MLQPVAEAKSLDVKDFAAARRELGGIAGRHEGMGVHRAEELLLEIGGEGLVGVDKGEFLLCVYVAEVDVARAHALELGEVEVGVDRGAAAQEALVRSDGYPNVNRRYYFNGELLTDDAGKMGRYHFLYTSSGDLEYVPSEYE